MVYTDGTHMVADSLEELHQFAQRIGLKRCWWSNKRGKYHPHYDLHGKFHQISIDNGAKQISSKEILVISNRLAYSGYIITDKQLNQAFRDLDKFKKSIDEAFKPMSYERMRKPFTI